MKRFKESIESHEYAYPEVKKDYDDYIVEFNEEVLHSLRRQFLNEEEHKPMRLSALGKTPAFELLAKKLNKISMGGKNTVNERLRMIFSLGDWFESYCNFLIKRVGYEIVEQQRTVEWNGVSGHTDSIIKDEDGVEHLLEIKSANDWYFKQVSKQGHPGDERGYLTQLLTYSESTGIPRDRTHWVFFNKNTCEMMVIDLDSVDNVLAEARLNRARSIIKAYNKCESDKELYTMVQPPPPKIEKTKDGKFVLNDDGSLKLYSPPEVGHPDFCYITEWGKTRWGKKRLYVVDYNYPKEYQSYKPDIKEMALAHN